MSPQDAVIAPGTLDLRRTAEVIAERYGLLVQHGETEGRTAHSCALFREEWETGEYHCAAVLRLRTDPDVHPEWAWASVTPHVVFAGEAARGIPEDWGDRESPLGGKAGGIASASFSWAEGASDAGVPPPDREYFDAIPAFAAAMAAERALYGAARRTARLFNQIDPVRVAGGGHATVSASPHRTEDGRWTVRAVIEVSVTDEHNIERALRALQETSK